MERTRQQSEVIERLKNLFLEIPGTQLTATNAARLSGLDVEDCRIGLQALEQTRFLARGRGGLFLHRSADSPAGTTARPLAQFDGVGNTRLVQARFND